MASVKLQQVTKRYSAKRGDVWAVRDLSIDVADREFMVLVGPSGCGKTTALRLTAGLESLDGGSIEIGGSVVDEVAPKDRDIAMVFQDYALYPHMTVFKNMAFGLKMRGAGRAEIRRSVDEAARLLNIEGLLERKPSALSGGECQRVALGRAIVRRPRVFLFDEPLSNLDAQLRTQMRTEIKELHRKLETTIVYVTHDQEEAMTLGDRIAVMQDGAIRQCDTPLEVYQRPSSRFVAGFIGSPTMNFLEGRLAMERESPLFVGEAIRVALPNSLRTTVAEAVGSAVSLGVRPEHLSVEGARDGTTDGSAGLTGMGEMTVHAVEPLGNATNLHLLTSRGDRLLARGGSVVSVSVGQTVSAGLDAGHVHLFSSDGQGERLS